MSFFGGETVYLSLDCFSLYVIKMKNPAVDSYIETAPEYAQPILNHFRELIHNAFPEIEEQIKWQMPSFELEGKIVCSFAAFKKHSVLRFWNGDRMQDPTGLLQPVGKSTMRHIGNVSSFDKLPDTEILKGFIKEAGELSKS